MMTFGGQSFSIGFNPVFGPETILALSCLGLLLLLYSLWTVKQGWLWRGLAAMVLLIVLLRPSLLEEERNPVKDSVLVVLDQSASQNFGDRASIAADTYAHVMQELERNNNLDLQTLQIPQDGSLSSETRLFSSIDQALSTTPPSRRAGLIIISDGQIHDVPDHAMGRDTLFGPVHHLVTGHHDEKDRRLHILQAPSYGITGQDITIKYRIDDTSNINTGDAALTFKQPSQKPRVFQVQTNKDLSITVPVHHAGENIYELNVQSVPDELTTINNKAALRVNGVRERLKVLLVSGQPHAGGRMWRDLLTSDPNVDLVHFTILRQPEKLDNTPQNELALIAFPFRELFEVKLYDFDLVIFDRYRLYDILPDFYFKNIADYVREGGAFLQAAGPDYASEDSIFYTDLAGILPGIPTGKIHNEAFKPALSEIGKSHPVTASLVWDNMRAAGRTDPQWGPWLRHIGVEYRQGDILMTGPDKRPLLILNRINEGRVAQLASDHIWLWARGYKGGGPHSELLRRIVHWLMKEPELDELALEITVENRRITIKSRDRQNQDQNITMTKPDGEALTLPLKAQENGSFQTQYHAETQGVYSFENDHGDIRYAIIGDLNAPEFSAVTATDDKLSPLVSASGGSVQWIAEQGMPDIRTAGPNRRHYGWQGWIGLRQNNAYTVEGLKQKPLLPGWAMLLLVLGTLCLAWWQEGRSKNQ